MIAKEREELASLYALGLLEGQELAAFELALAKDSALGVLVSEFEQASNVLATGLVTAAPPASLKRSVMSVAKAAEPADVVEAKPGFSMGWLPWALAAGLAIYCGFQEFDKTRLAKEGVRLALENRSLQDYSAKLANQENALAAHIAAMDAQQQKLEDSIASLMTRDPLKEIEIVTLAPQPVGSKTAQVVALWDQELQKGALRISKLPAPASGRDYQLWIITPESQQPLSAGVVDASSGEITFRSPHYVGQVTALAISVEPKGGSPLPTGPIVYLGKVGG